MASVPPRRLSIGNFRPRTFDEIIGQTTAIARLRKFLDGARNGLVVPPHMIFHGPPGVGKTSAARVFAREALGDRLERDFSEMNPWDDRSPNAIYRLFELSRTPPAGGAPFRIVHIDEAEALTPESQVSLRPALEREESYSVYILSVNELDRLAKPVQSRCVVLEFRPLEPQDMRLALSLALQRTPFQLDDTVLESIVERSQGVPREAIKHLLEEGGARHSVPQPRSSESSG